MVIGDDGQIGLVGVDGLGSREVCFAFFELSWIVHLVVNETKPVVCPAYKFCAGAVECLVGVENSEEK